MSGVIYDLDVLMPDSENVVSFTGRFDKKKYDVDLFIPSGVAAVLLENLDEITSAFPSGGRTSINLSPAIIQIIEKVLCALMEESYPEINPAWIRKNLSLPKQAFIVTQMIKPIYEFLVQGGYMPSIEDVKKNLMSGVA